MLDLPTTISNLISNQFPEIYREEGPTFVSFVEAYYEWLEQNFQLIKLENNEGFRVGSFIKQEEVEGVVVAIIEDELLVLVNGRETFKCFNICSDLIPVTTITDGVEYSTLLLKGGVSRKMGSIFQSRNIQNYRDIDRTIDLFIVQFKEKYLKNIEFDTLTNKRLLVKNALSLYRAKGTERAIDLFFRLIYGVNAEVKDPSDFLFQPSGSEWTKSTYLEISPDTVKRAIELVGKEITGVSSGAKAFVEKYVKLKTNSGFSHVLFVSNIKGEFRIREILRDDRVFEDSPIVYGSLNRVDITAATFQFAVGDIVPLESFTGINGLARVTEIRFADGQVEFELENGGYGFTSNFANTSNLSSNTIVADQFLTLTEVEIGNVASTVSIITPGSGYSNADTIEFISNFGRNAKGRIITNPTGGIVDVIYLDRGTGFIAEQFGDIGSNIVTSTGVDAEVVCITKYPTEYITLLDNVRQIGNPTEPEGFVVSIPTNIAIYLRPITGPISIGDSVFQVDPDEGVVATGTVVRTNLNLNEGLVVLGNITGTFRKNYPILSNRPEFNATLIRIDSLQFAIKLRSTNPFEANNQYLVTANTFGFTGKAVSISSGEDAQFFITEVQDTEFISVNTDILGNNEFLQVSLGATEYNLPFDPEANAQSTIFDSLTFDVLEIGKIKSIGGINPGNNYSVDPEVLIFQPYITGFNKRDISAKITDLNGSFAINELVQQTYQIQVKTLTLTSSVGLRVGEPVFVFDDLTSSIIATAIIREISGSNIIQLQNVSIENIPFVGFSLRSSANEAFVANILQETILGVPASARARVKSFDTENLFLERLTFDDVYTVGVPFVGVFSGVSANVISFANDESTRPLGFNADVNAESITTDGTIAGLQVIDSGFGFIDGQIGTYFSPQGREGRFRAINGGIGTGSGSYRTIKGFMSDQAKLFDGDYYQEYSYDIISRIPISKYADMFKVAMHTAGTRFFGSVLIDSEIDISNKNDLIRERMTNVDSDIIVDNVSPYTVNSVNIFTSPTRWGATSADPNIRNDLVPVVDFESINIETRS